MGYLCIVGEMKSNLTWMSEVPDNCTCEILGSDIDDTMLLGIDPDCPVHGNADEVVE